MAYKNSNTSKDKVNGALFDNEKKQGQQPDFFGSITVTEDFARELYNRCRTEGDFRLNVSAWWKKPKNRDSKVDRFISLSVDFGQEKKGDSRDARGPARDDRDRDGRDNVRHSSSKGRDYDDRDRVSSRGDARRDPPARGGDFDDEIPF